MSQLNNRIRQGDLALSLTHGHTVAVRSRDEVVPECTADTRSRCRAVLDPPPRLPRPGDRPAQRPAVGPTGVADPRRTGAREWPLAVGNATHRSRPAAKSGLQVPPAAILVDWEIWVRQEEPHLDRRHGGSLSGRDVPARSGPRLASARPGSGGAGRAVSVFRRIPGVYRKGTGLMDGLGPGSTAVSGALRASRPDTGRRSVFAEHPTRTSPEIPRDRAVRPGPPGDVSARVGRPFAGPTDGVSRSAPPGREERSDTVM
jgi:hypothetical protein